LLVFCSCTSIRFAKDGIFVDDVDEYFNPRQDINVWVYANFHPYRGKQSGVKMKSLYEEDLAVLKQIHFKTRGTKILFSARPEGDPYHLIAIQHLKKINNLVGFERKDVDSSYYYQKDEKLGRLDIRQVYIPYGQDKGLSLIYYVSTEKHLRCPYCKLDYLARVNANTLQHEKSNLLYWAIFNCEERKQVQITMPIDAELIKKHNRSFLKIYADYGHARGIQYFQILNRNTSPKSTLKLCPEKYIIELSDSKHRMLKSDTLVVH